MRPAVQFALALAVLAASGCGDDCASVARFDDNGLIAAGACGDLPTRTSTATPTATPAP